MLHNMTLLFTADGNTKVDIEGIVTGRDADSQSWYSSNYFNPVRASRGWNLGLGGEVLLSFPWPVCYMKQKGTLFLDLKISQL